MSKKAKKYGIKVPFGEGDSLWLLNIEEGVDYENTTPVLFDSVDDAIEYLEQSAWINCTVEEYPHL